MMWSYWMELYLRTHCVARGLRPLTISAYEDALLQFREWTRMVLRDAPPDQISARDVLAYLQHLRIDRGNGDSAINRAVVVLRSFYRAIVAMGHLDHSGNPLNAFPSVKAVPRKLPVSLPPEDIRRLMQGFGVGTIIDLRDHAIVAILYATGLRANECATLTCGQVDLQAMTVSTQGKGGHERCVPLNEAAVAVLKRYVQARGPATAQAPFFRSRFGRPLTRSAVYERVRTRGRQCRLSKPLHPHRLRHTFATHLVRAGVGLVTIRDLLGHKQITSTQIYLHVTAEDLRSAAAKHPIAHLLGTVQDLLPGTLLPFQRPRFLRGYG